VGYSQHVPTLGYPTQKDAIIALYEQRAEPKKIAQLTGAPINSVHRALHDYRVSTGRLIDPIRVIPTAPRSPNDTWPDSLHAQRMAAYRRAVKGARITRKAMEVAGP